MDSLIGSLVGGDLSANSHKGVATLYGYAKIRMTGMIKTGELSYTTDAVGGITSMSYKHEAINALKDELKIMRSQINAVPEE